MDHDAPDAFQPILILLPQDKEQGRSLIRPEFFISEGGELEMSNGPISEVFSLGGFNLRSVGFCFEVIAHQFGPQTKSFSV